MSKHLRSEKYFADRADTELKANLKPTKHSIQQTLAAAARIIGHFQEDAGLAGQISARAEGSSGGGNTYRTLRFGLGFEEATSDDFIEVDQDLHTITGTGIANPATRFHLWIYRARPDVQSILHTHSPYCAALAAAVEPLIVCQMDMTPFYNNCAFLPKWPSLPIADQEGEIISAALGNKKSIILANHGQLTAGISIEEAAFLCRALERSARIQIRAAAAHGGFAGLKPVPGELAQTSRDFLLKPHVVRATFDYWVRKCGWARPMPSVEGVRESGHVHIP